MTWLERIGMLTLLFLSIAAAALAVCCMENAFGM